MSHLRHGAGPGNSDAARLGSYRNAAARPSSGGGPADLLATVTELRERVSELERLNLSGGADRPICLKELAGRIGNGKSVASLRGWMKRPATRKRLRLELLLRKDPTGHWYSTPRLLARWQDALRHDAIRSSLRRCFATQSRPPILPTVTRTGEGRRNDRKSFGETPAGAGRGFSVAR